MLKVKDEDFSQSSEEEQGGLQLIHEVFRPELSDETYDRKFDETHTCNNPVFRACLLATVICFIFQMFAACFVNYYGPEFQWEAQFTGAFFVTAWICCNWGRYEYYVTRGNIFNIVQVICICCMTQRYQGVMVPDERGGKKSLKKNAWGERGAPLKPAPGQEVMDPQLVKDKDGQWRLKGDTTSAYQSEDDTHRDFKSKRQADEDSSGTSGSNDNSDDQAAYESKQQRIHNAGCREALCCRADKRQGIVQNELGSGDAKPNSGGLAVVNGASRMCENRCFGVKKNGGERSASCGGSNGCCGITPGWLWCEKDRKHGGTVEKVYATEDELADDNQLEEVYTTAQAGKGSANQHTLKLIYLTVIVFGGLVGVWTLGLLALSAFITGEQLYLAGYVLEVFLIFFALLWAVKNKVAIAFFIQSDVPMTDCGRLPIPYLGCENIPFCRNDPACRGGLKHNYEMDQSIV